MLGDDLWIGVEIEHATDPVDHLRQRLRVRQPCAEDDCVPAALVAYFDMPALAVDVDGATVGIAGHALDAGNRARGQEREQGLPREGRLIGQQHHVRAAREWSHEAGIGEYTATSVTLDAD